MIINDISRKVAVFSNPSSFPVGKPYRDDISVLTARRHFSFERARNPLRDEPWRISNSITQGHEGPNLNSNGRPFSQSEEKLPTPKTGNWNGNKRPSATINIRWIKPNDKCVSVVTPAISFQFHVVVLSPIFNLSCPFFNVLLGNPVLTLILIPIHRSSQSSHSLIIVTYRDQLEP